MSTILLAQSLDHINMSVKNLGESVAFYERLFGFKVKKAQADMNSKIIGNKAISLCLYQDASAGEASGLNHFGFHIANFDEILARCKEMNVRVLYGGAVGWGEEGSRSIYIEDPSGYTIELSEQPGGGL